MPAVKCITCLHLHMEAGGNKSRCDLGKFDRPTRNGPYKGGYSITRLAMGTPFLRRTAEKCAEYTAR